MAILEQPNGAVKDVLHQPSAGQPTVYCRASPACRRPVVRRSAAAGCCAKNETQGAADSSKRRLD